MRNVTKTKHLIEKLQDKKYRESFAEEYVWTGVPFQVKTLREDRKWTQGDLAEKAKMAQPHICRLEDINYGGFTMKSLLRLAAAFDVALLVKFVPFSRLLKETEDLSPSALSAQEFSEEQAKLDKSLLELEDARVYLFPTGERVRSSGNEMNLRPTGVTESDTPASNSRSSNIDTPSILRSQSNA